MRDPNDDFRLVKRIPANVSIDTSVDNVLDKTELEKIRLQNTLQGEVWGPYDTLDKRDYRIKLARETKEKGDYIREHYLTDGFKDPEYKRAAYYNKVR
jgi:hypothetical protein